MEFTCGIDIGMKNMCITFVSDRCIVVYKGSPLLMERLEKINGVEPICEEIQAFPPRTLKKDIDHRKGFINLMSKMSEFAKTRSTVIEMQLAYNNTEMSRLDGIAFGFLNGRHPSMVVNINASTIRKGFITKALAGVDVSGVTIPRGLKDTKLASCQFVGARYPEFYAIIISIVDKHDDICDAVVYACIAAQHVR